MRTTVACDETMWLGLIMLSSKGIGYICEDENGKQRYRGPFSDTIEYVYNPGFLPKDA